MLARDGGAKLPEGAGAEGTVALGCGWNGWDRMGAGALATGGRTGPGCEKTRVGSEREGGLSDTMGCSLREGRGVTPRTVTGANGFLGARTAGLAGAGVVFGASGFLLAMSPEVVTGALVCVPGERVTKPVRGTLPPAPVKSACRWLLPESARDGLVDPSLGLGAVATRRSVRGRKPEEAGVEAEFAGWAEPGATFAGCATVRVLPSVSSTSRRVLVTRTSVVPLRATCRMLPRVARWMRSKPTPWFITVVLFTVV